MVTDCEFSHTRKNLTICSKSETKPSTSCVRTACYKLSTSLRQAVNNQGRNLSDNWGGGGLFIYSCYAGRISFQTNLNSKEIRRAEHEYMNKHPPPPQLAF